MSEFVIKSVDNFKNLYWLDTYMMGHNGFIAGGCFRNIFDNTPVKDIDIFFENNEDYTKAKSYYENKDNFIKYYDNKKVVAFKHTKNGMVIELIQSVFGKPEEIINNFDFSITKFAYYKEKVIFDEEEITEYKIIHHKDYFEHLHLKRLVTNEMLIYPNSTFERLLKYAKYGYFPCRETKMHIINNIKNSNNEFDILSESLYDGVD